ncbi:hypothetical protein [Corynebacterium urinipleomorphum]|uniref:hypothetical protein n=1 Tax=Corynebacterium urinipleomorphum TaxID=1852380 RepID=UPI001F1F32FD|nr:hypothetical protein [Corynebacterium urinipleomorphum]
MTHQPPYRPDRPTRADRGASDRGLSDRASSDRAGRSDGLNGYGEEHRPLPQEIYTRRRVAAVVVILAVVALVVWALTAFARSGGDDVEETPTPPPSTLVTTPTEPNPGEESGTETTTGTSDAAATEESKTGESESTEPTKATSSPEDAEALAAKKTCELSDLQLSTDLNKTAFAPGDPASERKFSVTIHNPTGGDCVIDTEENPLRFAAFSIDREGFQQIWSDTDCNKPMITGKETFAAGESRKFTAEWSGLDSAPQRCDARQPAAPGAYAAVGFLGENSSEPVTFNVTE